MTLWESRHLKEFSMSVSLLNILLLKEEFIQRFWVHQWATNCCSRNFSQISENFGPSLLILFAPLYYMFGLFEAKFFCYLGFRLGLCMLWTVRLSRFYNVLSLRFKMGLSFAVFRRSTCVLLLENRPRFSIFSEKDMILIRGHRLIEFRCCGPRID